MRLLAALLCFALMTSGCSAVSDMRRDAAAGQGRRLGATDALPRKASLTSSPSTTPQKAPAKPASGPGVIGRAAPATECPDVDPAAYEALATPTELPPAKALITWDDNRGWIERLEGQVGRLRGHLNKSVQSHIVCRGAHKP